MVSPAHRIRCTHSKVSMRKRLPKWHGQTVRCFSALLPGAPGSSMVALQPAFPGDTPQGGWNCHPEHLSEPTK
jgi:hypothetical protein